MIRSVRFTADNKDDYINEVIYKTVPRKGYTWEYVENAKKSRMFRLKYGNDNYMTKSVRVGFKNPILRKCVMKRTFEFSEDKINVLFGPNGSGKTTILRNIAAHCLCGADDINLDGYTSLLKYTKSFAFFDLGGKTDYMNFLLGAICKNKRNSSEVIWDGSPVFYENLTGRKNYGLAGELVGGIIRDFKEEFMWMLNSKSSSAGQNTIMLLQKLIRIAENFMTPDELIQEAKTAISNNNYVTQYLETTIEYYKSQLSETPGRPTILLDEMDRSLDLLNVFGLYSDLLPAIMKKFGVQIIVVSHSPIVLMNKIFNSEEYNIISMDKKYTKECIKTLNSLI